MDEFEEKGSKRKRHNEPHGGRKAEKKKAKNPHEQEMTAKQRNPKAFAFNSVQKAERQFRRTMDIRTKKEHIPQVDRTALEPPPFIVAVVGPPKVGKTLLLRCLIKNFCKQNLTNIQGPVTIVSGKKRRLTLIECNNDVNSMIDLAKVCDLALLLVDASFGFEMETFEFLNICQVHGFPKIMGVLTHLDVFKNAKTLRRTKKQMKHRFWTEIYQGAKLFYLSGMVHDEYMKNEVHNLGRFISVMKFHPQLWRQNHSYVLADRMEDLTNPDLIRKNPVVDRTICLYGYTRGAPLKNHTKVHIPGCSDFAMKEVSFLSDPCPLPDKEKKRSLNEKERLIYAPMSGVGGIVYDKDAVYIELGGSHSHNKAKDEGNFEKGLLSNLINSEHGLDSKMEASAFTLFSGAKPLTTEEIERNQVDNTHEDEDRRKVTFSDDEDENSDSDGDEDNEEATDNDETSDEDDSEQEIGHLKWKDNLALKAASSFEHRERNYVNLALLVYGSTKSAWGEKKETLEEDNDEDDEIIGGLFKRASQLRSGGKSELTYSNLNGDETSKISTTGSRDWEDDEVCDLIKDCFVTGKWDSNNDAKALLDLDEEMFGDFEDLETGVTQKGVEIDDASDDDEDKDENNENIKEDSSVKKTRAEKIMDKKKKLKAMFDSEYDEKDGKSYYDDLKAEMSEQAQLNRSEFENLDDDKRVQLEGFRAGMYVRVEVENVPCEFVKHFDSTYPIILGSLLHGEDTQGYVQVRLKKHRWYKRILKTRDPLIFSLGWRRFQTMPIYSIEDHNGRNRMLKYTPQHLYCLASFWGPITPQGAGILALQSITEKTHDFRIAATGVVLDLDKSTQIMKKLKLTGEPLKIHKKTAFIKGMFNSKLEVTKFEGAALRTVSGLRGQIKKAIRAPPGAFRATFEDKILMSDIIFLRSWYAVAVPQFYAPVTSLLLPPEGKIKWQGMKTVGQLKREKGLQALANSDSLYTPIERKERFFKDLKIPKSLQQELPFADKKRYGVVDKATDIQKQRIAVIQEPHEKEVSNMMKMIKTVHSAKLQRLRQETDVRVKAHKLGLKKIEEKRNNRQKMIKKRVFQALGKMKKNKD